MRSNPIIARRQGGNTRSFRTRRYRWIPANARLAAHSVSPGAPNRGSRVPVRPGDGVFRLLIVLRGVAVPRGLRRTSNLPKRSQSDHDDARLSEPIVASSKVRDRSGTLVVYFDQGPRGACHSQPGCYSTQTGIFQETYGILGFWGN